ncbi:hypothetical protein LJC62_04430, partial [Odoribacter sp. OttesenSCG-928-A06]|nr:hypothetical protein [Odoribacter sp. OttesenSCG-928-A06]
YAIMGLIIPFYMLFNRKGYLSTYRFFRKRFAYSPMKAFGFVYRNHFRFGQIILDRFATYGGKRFEFEFDGIEYFNERDAEEEGFIQLSSHVGNYELAGYSLTSKNKRFNALVFSGETETVMKNRHEVLSQNNMCMIPVQADLSHIFLLNNALSNGEIVSIPADRVFGSPKFVLCHFLGEEAKFPMGPFIMAAQRECALLAVFVMKESAKRYKIFVRKVEYQPNPTGKTSRQEKVSGLAQSFAEQLEEVIKKYPEQWFNYYDFWEKN